MTDLLVLGFPAKEKAEAVSAAVFALVRRSTPDRVRQALLPYDPTIIRTSLPIAEESELIRRLQEMRAAVPAPPEV